MYSLFYLKNSTIYRLDFQSVLCAVMPNIKFEVHVWISPYLGAHGQNTPHLFKFKKLELFTAKGFNDHLFLDTLGIEVKHLAREVKGEDRVLGKLDFGGIEFYRANDDGTPDYLKKQEFSKVEMTGDPLLLAAVIS